MTEPGTVPVPVLVPDCTGGFGKGNNSILTFCKEHM